MQPKLTRQLTDLFLLQSSLQNVTEIVLYHRVNVGCSAVSMSRLLKCLDCSSWVKLRLDFLKNILLLLFHNWGPVWQHRMHEMLTIVTDVRGVCQSDSLSVTRLQSAAARAVYAACCVPRQVYGSGCSCPPSPTSLRHVTTGLRTVWHLEKTTRSSAIMLGGAGHHEHRALSFWCLECCDGSVSVEGATIRRRSSVERERERERELSR